MIEKIFHKKKLFALIVRSKFRKKNGINFFTKNYFTHQFGYMKHEKQLFEEITELRAQSDSANSVTDQGKAESSLSNSLMNLFAVAENYPELKANENFIDLQKQLQDIENEIQMARRYYQIEIIQ